jgi:hypothetical protein
MPGPTPNPNTPPTDPNGNCINEYSEKYYACIAGCGGIHDCSDFEAKACYNTMCNDSYDCELARLGSNPKTREAAEKNRQKCLERNKWEGLGGGQRSSSGGCGCGGKKPSYSLAHEDYMDALYQKTLVQKTLGGSRPLSLSDES